MSTPYCPVRPRRPAAAVTPPKDDTAYVSFKVTAETRWGDAVVIVGSCDQLGSWAPSRGLRLSTDERTYPMWRCQPTPIARNPAEYKVVILRAPGSELEWEPLAENRSLRLDQLEQQVTVTISWGAAASQVRTAGYAPAAPLTPSANVGGGCTTRRLGSAPSLLKPAAHCSPNTGPEYAVLFRTRDRTATISKTIARAVPEGARQ